MSAVEGYVHDHVTMEDVLGWAAAKDEVARALDRLDAEDSLRNYSTVMWSVLEPGRDFKTGWVLDAIFDHLEGITLGHLRKVLLNVPPGFMKSLSTNVMWPSWEWGPRRKPWLRYVGASYSDALTIRDNDRCRQLIRSSVYQRLWGPQREECSWVRDKSKPCDCGAVFHLRPDRDAVSHYENNRTGWKMATSVGGTGTGARGDRFVIDDPHSVKTAESEAVRESTLQWATEVVATRKNDENSCFVVIMQRVHERDVAGLYMSAELGFTHLCIPMRYEHEHPHVWMGSVGRCTKEVTEKAADAVDEHGDPVEPRRIKLPTCHQYGKGDPRQLEGELAWPERFPANDVDETEKAMSAWGGSYAVSGQQQQRPTPRGGGMFQRDDFKTCTAEWAIKKGGRIIRGWDLAGSRKKTSPWTVGVRMRRTPDGLIIIEHVARVQGSPGEVEDLLLTTARWDGHGVEQDFPQDPGQAGLHQIAAFGRLLEGFTFHCTPESGSKEDRARPLASQCEVGNVYIVRGDWNDTFLDNICSFPRGQFKDDADAASRAYDAHLRSHDDFPISAPSVVTSR